MIIEYNKKSKNFIATIPTEYGVRARIATGKNRIEVLMVAFRRLTYRKQSA